MLPPAAYGDHSISSCEYLYAEWQEHLELCFQLAVPNVEIWAFWYERKLYRARYGEDWSRVEQAIAAAAPAPALHEAVVLKVKQDLLEELLWQIVALGDVGDEHGLVVVLLGE
jgi:hypothetical protein